MELRSGRIRGGSDGGGAAAPSAGGGGGGAGGSGGASGSGGGGGGGGGGDGGAPPSLKAMLAGRLTCCVGCGGSGCWRGRLGRSLSRRRSRPFVPRLFISLKLKRVVVLDGSAPNLKGRPRKRPKKRSLSPGGSESNESESSLSTVSSSLRVRSWGGKPLRDLTPSMVLPTREHIQKSKQQTPGRNGLRCNSIAQQNSPARGKKVEREVGPDEKEFLVKLHSFMKSRRTPISRVPHLGFKEIDLFAFFTKVQKLGGYNSVTANRLWKTIYDELGGHQGSTSAATYTRRHYERLLLPYEKSIRGEQKEGSGIRNHAKLKAVKSEDKSDEEKDDADSPTESSSDKGAEISSPKEKNSLGESKTSSLRSVRPKMEKLEENVPSDKENIPESNSLSQVTTPSSVSNTSTSGNSNSSPTGMVNGSLSKTSGTTNSLTNGEVSSTPNFAGTTESSAEDNDTKVSPEVIDLATEESQAKIGKTSVPAFKKRKLEILKEGGLEVTAISSLGSETSVTPVVEKRPSVIQHAAPVTAAPSDNQVSITVTPDVGHILGSPRGEVASTPSPISAFDTSVNHSNVINVQDLKHKMHNQNLPHDTPAGGTWSRRLPPKVVQSRSIYTHSESTVYGNPKDILDPRQLLYSERALRGMVPHPEEEVLDLRVKSPQKSTMGVNRVHPMAASMDAPRNLSKTVSKTNNNSAFPLLAGRAIVGSNLEITVVDVPKTSANQVKVNPPLPQKPHHPPSRKTANKTPSHRLPPRNENGKFMSMNNQSQAATLHRSASNSSGGTSLIIPNPYLSSACGRSTPSSRTRVSQSQSTVPTSSPSGILPSFLPGSTSLFPGFLPPVSAANNGGKNSNPFLALSDPLYYSSLYTSHGLYPPSLTPGFVSPLVTPPLFPPSAEQIQLYKELMSQHHTSLRLAQQGAAGFLGLPRDGSTSITPVGPSTNPSSK